MLITNERRWGPYEAPIAKVLDGAIRSLPSTERKQSGYLCEDIASRGFSERMAVAEAFNSQELMSKSPARKRLASQVCERCVRLFECKNPILSPDDFPEIDTHDTVISTRKDIVEPEIEFLSFDAKTSQYYFDRV